MNLKGTTRTTPFLDKVEFIFKNQGGSMKKATVNLDKFIAIM